MSNEHRLWARLEPDVYRAITACAERRGKGYADIIEDLWKLWGDKLDLIYAEQQAIFERAAK